MQRDLLLTREQLDEIKKSSIFTLWLYSNLDENLLTSEEKDIIYARQVYYELLISDEQLSSVLDRVGCYGVDTLLDDTNKLTLASHILGTSTEILRAKAMLYKRRKDVKMKEFIREL